MFRLLSQRTLRSLLAIVLIGMLVGACSSTAKIVGPVTEHEVATTWIGLSGGERYLLRITLEETDHLGLLGFIYHDNDPMTFRLEGWSLEEGRIALHLQPSDATVLGWQTPIRGVVNANTMHLELRGSDWKRTVSLRPEKRWQLRWERLKSSMDEAA